MAQKTYKGDVMNKGKTNKTTNTTLPFIKTSDEITMNVLKAEGFELIDNSNGIWTFINRPSTKYNFAENDKIAFSNMLCI